MSRKGSRVSACVLGWALLASPAHTLAQADPVFDPDEAGYLADLLADATEAQGVCYGWSVHVTDAETGITTQSVGSNLGPGRDVESGGRDGGSCARAVEFTADIEYVSSSSDLDDSARWSVTGWPPGGVGTGDLDRLGLFDEGDLIGEDPDLAVARAVAALPQLAAEADLAPPLRATPASSAPPDVGSLVDDPGSDYLRRTGGLLAFGVVLLVGAGAFAVTALRSSRSRPGPSPPSQPPPPHRSPPVPPPSQQ